MAISTPVMLVAASSEKNDLDVSSASFTIGDGESAWAFVASRTAPQTPVITSDLGLVWTEQYQTTDGRMTVFSAVGDASSTGVFTVTNSGPTHLHIVGVANANQIPVQEAERAFGGGTTNTVTLAATDADSVTLGMVICTTPETVTSGDTELDQSTIDSSGEAGSQYTTGTDNILSWTFGTGTESVGYAFELQEDTVVDIVTTPTTPLVLETYPAVINEGIVNATTKALTLTTYPALIDTSVSEPANVWWSSTWWKSPFFGNYWWSSPNGGSVQSEPATVTGNGIRIITGTGYAQSAPATVSGSGFKTTNTSAPRSGPTSVIIEDNIRTVIIANY